MVLTYLSVHFIDELYVVMRVFVEQTAQIVCTDADAVVLGDSTIEEKYIHWDLSGVPLVFDWVVDGVVTAVNAVDAVDLQYQIEAAFSGNISYSHEDNGDDTYDVSLDWNSNYDIGYDAGGGIVNVANYMTGILPIVVDMTNVTAVYQDGNPFLQPFPADGNFSWDFEGFAPRDVVIDLVISDACGTVSITFQVDKDGFVTKL